MNSSSSQNKEPANSDGSDQTIYQWLQTQERAQPDGVAIATADKELTFRQLGEATRSLAAGLARLGVGRGDVVAVQLPNIPEFLTLLLATSARGAILQTLHMPYRESELETLLVHSGAKAAVALGAFKDRSPAGEIIRLRNKIPRLESVIAVGAPVEGTHDYATVCTATPDPDTVLEADVDAPYLLLYTSGTTAQPKGVAHSSRQFLQNAALASTELDLTNHDRVTSLAPFSHLYGMFTLQIALAAGSCTAMIPAFNPQTFLGDLADLIPTALFTAPAHLAPFIASDKLTPSSLATTRLVCLSGSAVPPQLAQAVDDLLPNGSVIGLWGMTELQVGAFGRPGDPLQSRISTAGRAATGIQLRTVDSDGAELPSGNEGELQARDSSVFSEYLNDSEATAAAFTSDGWFKTGDLAEIDANGYLRITGRTKEIINRGGIKYNPADVEAILVNHPAIAVCAIVPVPDSTLGERGCLCVQTTPGETITLEEACQLLDENKMAKYKWPERLELFEELPMTPTRKVQRGKVAALLNK